MTVQEALQPWWFDSHNSSKRSPWLQSTLSELQEKTKGMLKLIEGDADSFAQRAEMYYKKRPELVNMIEDFYRAFRSLAERYDQLKTEAGNCHAKASDSTFSNRNWLQKAWSITNKSSETYSGFSDSEESVVDDPEPEEAEAESNLREMPEKRNDGCMVRMMTAEELNLRNTRYWPSEFYSDFYDSGSLETDDSEQEKAKVESENQWSKVLEKKNDGDLMNVVERLDVSNKENVSSFASGMFECDYKAESKSREFLEKKSRSNEVNQITEAVERIESKVRYTVDESSDSILRLSNFEESEDGLEPEEDQAESKLRNAPDKKCDSGTVELRNEVERLNVENATLEAELARKDEEKRNVIRQLSLSVAILKEENDYVRKFIKGSKKSGGLFEFKKLKGVFSGLLFGSRSKFQTTIDSLRNVEL